MKPTYVYISAVPHEFVVETVQRKIVVAALELKARSIPEIYGGKR